jgi:CDGSH-type Zn-finger protein
VSGDVVVQRQDGSEIVRDTRLALCRCGASKNKPFCDGAHTEAGFQAPGASEPPVVQTRSAEERPLTFLAATDGPLLAEGACELLTEDGCEPEKAASGSYCRCGASQAKPFCDGSHYAIGFQVE